MALKDWKKIKDGVRTDPPTISWENKKEHLTLSVGGWKTYITNETGYDVLVNYYNPKEKVHRRIMFNGADRKRFKSKSEALKFAKDYMRKN